MLPIQAQCRAGAGRSTGAERAERAEEHCSTGVERAERAKEHQGRGVYVIHLCKCVDVPRCLDLR